jgi:hypothetical protein
MRWNGSVLGRRQPEGAGLWSLRAQAVLRQSNDWPYPIGLPVTSNLILHIDPSRADTVTLNNGYVSAITDLSGTGKTINQTTAARQPSYILNARNGLNAIGFNAGLTQFLNTTSITIPASHTVFHVFRRPQSGVNSFSIASGDRYTAFWFTDNNTYQWSNADFTTHGTANTSTGWFYSTTRRNGTTQMRVRRNGSTVADVTTGAGITNAASGSWSLIGNNAIYYMQGELGEVIVYNASLSDSDVTSVESYLAAKWGI